jgi:hypothetical protein
MKAGILCIALFWSFSSVSGFARRGGLSKGQKQAPVNRRIQKKTEPQKACEDSVNDPEACVCEDLNVNMTARTCLDSCNYCNEDLTYCGSPTSEEVFGIIGETTTISNSFAYNKGRVEVVVIAQTDCEMDDMGEVLCATCNVFVDGEECNQCTLNNCSTGANTGMRLPSFDCTNVEDDAVYDECDDSLIVQDGSVFEFLTTKVGEFDSCYESTLYPSASPTATATDSPSNIPSDMPSLVPSGAPSTSRPTTSASPTAQPSAAPTIAPTITKEPTGLPVTPVPTVAPVLGDGTNPEPTAGSASSRHCFQCYVFAAVASLFFLI